MANYTATLAKNATTSGGVVDTVTLRQDAKAVEIVNRGLVNLYCRTDGVDPVIDGDDSRIVLPGSSLNVLTPESTTVVKLISASVCSYSVFSTDGEGLKSVSNTGRTTVDTSTSSTLGDAFGRLRVSSPFTLIDTVHSYDLSPFYWDKIETTGGTVTSTPLLSAATLATTTSSGSRALFQTHNYLRYQPGKSQMILATGVLGPKTTNVLRRVGYFDDNDGLFFEVSGTDIAVVRRTSTSGTPQDNRVAQTNWNVDKMDGTGPSGITLDTTKMQIFVIDFQWLSIGQIRYGVEINGALFYVHISYHANALTVPYMRTANLPIRYEIVNTGVAAGANSLLAVCSTVLTEGGQQVFGTPFTANSGTTASSVSVAGTPVPVISIRPKLTFNSIANRGLIEVVQANTSNVQQVVLYETWLNPTLTGASWTSAGTNSIAETDAASTAMSGGTRLSSFYSGGNTGAHNDETINLEKLKLSLNAAGTVGDILTLSATKVSANDAAIYGSLCWIEHR